MGERSDPDDGFRSVGRRAHRRPGILDHGSAFDTLRHLVDVDWSWREDCIGNDGNEASGTAVRPSRSLEGPSGWREPGARTSSSTFTTAPGYREAGVPGSLVGFRRSLSISRGDRRMGTSDSVAELAISLARDGGDPASAVTALRESSHGKRVAVVLAKQKLETDSDDDAMHEGAIALLAQTLTNSEWT